MQLPTWEELESVEEQLDVLEHPLDESLFVAGPPGSGKTVLAVRRAQMIAEDEPDVVILTYNRMLRRLMSLLCEQSGQAESDIATIKPRIATMHNYVGPDYRGRMQMEPPTPPYDTYAFIWQDMLDAMEQRGLLPNKHHLVVDEGQDLPDGFFRYASGHISRTMSVFADDDQALTARRTTLEQIKRAAGLPDPIMLTQNHRNTPEIARLAEHFHTGELPAAEVRRPRRGEMPRLLVEPSLQDIVRRVSLWQTNQGGSTGVVVDQERTGEDLYKALCDDLPEESRVDIYTNGRRNENQINVLKDGVTIVNKESVKGQEFDAVFVLELHRFLPCQNDREQRAMYMMCSRARDDLWLICGPSGSLTQAIDSALPGPGVLERP